ncbi:MAG: hypothetical protein MUO60_11890 [Clostridiaceae bacterium]|nr:hypothetical protein [Clostridiaceae bacterium]
MGIGYLVGCLISILLWKIDRQGIVSFMNKKLRKKIKNPYVIQFLYLCALIAIYMGLFIVKNNEIYNAITAFVVLDISNTERKNINNTERKHFYDTMSTISRALVCGFIAPLFYIVILGNSAAIVFTLLYNISFDEELNLIGIFVAIANIIPSLITEVFLYIIYVLRNRKLKIKFKGDYISNLFKMPMLNVDILAAYIESVNFYCHYNGKKMHYLKSYGNYNNKIDDVCIKNYLSISYSICFMNFTAFVVVYLL